jgi:predicted MFS family arabinose efflux permease
VAAGIGPVVGGFLNDNVSPQAIWFGGGLIGFIGALWFLLQLKNQKTSEILKASEV